METSAGDRSNVDEDPAEPDRRDAGPNWWQRQFAVADTMLRASALVFAIGLGALFADSILFAGRDLPGPVIAIGEYLFLVAIVTVLVGLVLQMLTYLGHRAARRGWVRAEIGLPWRF